jgi:hypothetical protein
MTQWICNKAAQCKSTNYDICMHHHPHEKNHLCLPETEQDPNLPCYKAECNPILVDWDK